LAVLISAAWIARSRAMQDAERPFAAVASGRSRSSWCRGRWWQLPEPSHSIPSGAVPQGGHGAPAPPRQHALGCCGQLGQGCSLPAWSTWAWACKSQALEQTVVKRLLVCRVHPHCPSPGSQGSATGPVLGGSGHPGLPPAPRPGRSWWPQAGGGGGNPRGGRQPWQVCQQSELKRSESRCRGC